MRFCTLTYPYLPTCRQTLRGDKLHNRDHGLWRGADSSKIFQSTSQGILGRKYRRYRQVTSQALRYLDSLDTIVHALSHRALFKPASGYVVRSAKRERASRSSSLSRVVSAITSDFCARQSSGPRESPMLCLPFLLVLDSGARVSVGP